MIGSTFSHYRIVRKIGEGGMGEVFLADDLKLRRTVALKFLATRLTRDPDRKERFLLEARAAAAIEHPNVAVIHDVDEAEGRTFIAMEYVPGESLRDAILRKSLTLGRAIEIALQVADGLALAHARGVIHRDLKPENVLLSEQGYAKIIDFGLAKLLEPFGADEAHRSESETLLRTREGVVMGTVAYMSPEQARGESVDARSDVFSLGVMLHEMISGDSPFQRATAIETLNAILNEEPPAPRLPGANLPTGMERILFKAIVKNPAGRYQSVTDLASDLREVRAELASAGRGGAARERRERRWGLWMAAGAIVVAVALAVLFAVREPSLAPAIGASGRPAIAVLSFEDHSGDEALGWLSHGLPGMLLTGLAQTPGLDVISTRRIEEVLADVNPEPTVEASFRLAEAARRAGAGAVVTGSIYKAGSVLRLDVRVEDLESGRVLSAESVRGTDVFQLVDELTARVRESLRVEDRPAGRPIRDVTTASLEAYRLYSEGVEARHNVRHTDAWRLLEEAVAIDPSFAMAHFHLSAIASILGETALRDEHHRKAMENLARMPERQALLVQASDRAFRGRMEEAISLLEKLLALYPDEEEGYDTYLHARDRMREPEKVLEITDRWARAIPGPGSGHFHNHRGYAFLQLDRYQEAIRAFEDYARVRPEEANPYDSLGELHLVMGQPDAALDYYARALSLNPSFGFSLMGRVWASGMLGRYDELFAELARLEELGDSGYPVTGIRFMRAFALSRVGRLREASDEIRSDAGLAAQAGNTEAQVQFQLLSAWIQLESGDNADALEAVQKAGLSPPGSASPQAQRELLLIAHLLAGVAEARSGRVAVAQAHLSAMGTSPQGEPATETWYRKALEGEMAMAARNLSAAERAFTAGDPGRKMWFNLNRLPMTVFANGLPFRDGLARVAKARGDVAGAIAIYRKLLAPDVASTWTAVLEPRYVLELARLLGRAGEKEPARHEYQRFLDLWKDADPALPELREAREGAAAKKE